MVLFSSPIYRSGRSRFRTRSCAGFTILEILLVLALIGLLAGVLIGGSVRLLATRPVTVEGAFWETVSEVRKEALLNQREVRLRYDEKTRSLISISSAGERTFPLPSGEVQIDFLGPVSRSAGLVLIGGLLVETKTLPFVTFFDDGTCSPFRLQIRTGGPARILSIDPWTCAEVLVEPK